METVVSKKGTKFFINDALTYAEIARCPTCYQGLLMNARMIQGIFDDALDRQRFDRFCKQFNAQRNTDELIAALPDWYASGLRAITVGFQGGGPCFTLDNKTIDNNPFEADGLTMDAKYLQRMKSIIQAADQIGMAVIVSLFYGSQTRWLKDDLAVLAAVKTASNWLRDQQFTNVMIEVANEHDILEYRIHPILFTPNGMVSLIKTAQQESGGMMVGCSGTGGYFNQEIAQASDLIILHGNDQTRQRLYNCLQKAKAIQPARPIVINEDSQALSNMAICMDEGISWGYYNNMTKQEPPTDWRITKGEDEFFATRMALSLGLLEKEPPIKSQYYLQGLEHNATTQGRRWIRLACLFPERVNYVEFKRQGKPIGRSYDDPFVLNSTGSNWYQASFPDSIAAGEQWSATVFLTNGETIEVSTVAQ